MEATKTIYPLEDGALVVVNAVINAINGLKTEQLVAGVVTSLSGVLTLLLHW